MRNNTLKPLFSPIALQLMTLFFLREEEWLYLSDIAKKLNKTPSTLQRDLKAFVEADLLKTRKDGNRVYYRTNKRSPILVDLQSLLIKTVGVRDVVAQNLQSLSKSVSIGFIYGSLARAEEVATSDVDLMIIGNVSLLELGPFIAKCERQLAREVNPTLYSEKEFKSRVREENSFLKTVLAGKKLFVKGSEDELQTLVG